MLPLTPQARLGLFVRQKVSRAAAVPNHEKKRDYAKAQGRKYTAEKRSHINHVNSPVFSVAQLQPDTILAESILVVNSLLKTGAFTS